MNGLRTTGKEVIIGWKNVRVLALTLAIVLALCFEPSLTVAGCLLGAPTGADAVSLSEDSSESDSTDTPLPPATDTPTSVPTDTAVPPPADAPTSAPTDTPMPPATDTPTGIPTDTPLPSAADTPTGVFTPTITLTPAVTATFTPTLTATPTLVPTLTPIATLTASPMVTDTVTPAPTAVPAETETPTAIPPPAPIAPAALSFGVLVSELQWDGKVGSGLHTGRVVVGISASGPWRLVVNEDRDPERADGKTLPPGSLACTSSGGDPRYNLLEPMEFPAGGTIVAGSDEGTPPDGLQVTITYYLDVGYDVFAGTYTFNHEYTAVLGP